MKKTFVLIEQVFNGTVTMSINAIAVKADTFEKAVEILRSQPALKGKIEMTTEGHATYYISGQRFPVSGRMKNEEMIVLK